MTGFRMTSSNPFWFEDLVFFVIDESRRLPQRAIDAAMRARHLVELSAATVKRYRSTIAPRLARAPLKSAAAVRVPLAQRIEAELLDEPLTWTLATEPLTTSANGIAKVAELQEKAREQIDAISYTLDRMRDELNAVLTHAPIRPAAEVQAQPGVELDASIEQLRTASRKHRAPRPTDRILTAA